VSFAILAFGISWAIWSPLVLSTAVAQNTQWLLYYAGVLGPTVAAVLCASLSSESGSLLRRIRHWRVPLVWYGVALVLPFAMRGAAVGSIFLHEHRSWNAGLRSTELILSTTGLMLLLAPFEEIGWRGYALPILQREHTPLISSLIVAGMWALWHLPLAWASVGYQRSQTPWSYMMWFFITIVPLSCLATWLFNRSGESVLVVSLFHVAVNLADFVLILPAATGQVVLIITFILTTAIAGLVYWIDRLGMRPDATRAC
jgi:uncharacterized protein